ncbi:MAG TPA: YceH family protein [Solirubrobacteraceae bacterium]|nr:YceH family protein [Solirubrobacteraceae bacterium]
MSAPTRPLSAVSGLTSQELRVLGCLLEKQRTTPDAYPLSLNALRLACNQSTNRDPVVEYDDALIREALDRLQRRGITRLASGAGSRAPKFRHLLADVLPMDGAEQAILCVLMLRGAQTPGELKQRGERMHAFADLAEVLQTLPRLGERELLVRLERRPGQKEERYMHLLGESNPGEPASAPGEPSQPAEPRAAHDGVRAAAPLSSAEEPLASAGHPERHKYPAGREHAGAAPSPGELLERVEHLERVVAELRAQMRDPLS